MPCLSCAPKYDPGPDIGSRAPILMILSSARAAAETVTTSAAAIAPTAKERIRNRIVMALLRADFNWGQRTRQVRPELSPAHGFALSTSGRLGIRRFARATPRKAAVAAA